MKLTISNIAWTDAVDADVLSSLPAWGVNAVEIAPTRIWPNWDWAEQDAIAYRETLKKQGLVCSSLQAIVYNQPNLKLFGTSEEWANLVAHLKRVADLAAALGARPMVFGAPKNRDRGNLDEKTALRKAADLFAEVGEYCHQKHVCLCLEPNPTEYGCNFITDSASGVELVRQVNSPGFRLHLDTAGMYLAWEEIPEALERAFDVLEHVHVSEPNLGDFAAPKVDHHHIASMLKTLGWDKWISIEMRATNTPMESVKQAVDTVKSIYEVG